VSKEEEEEGLGLRVEGAPEGLIERATCRNKADRQCSPAPSSSFLLTSLELSDTKVHEPWIRACLAPAPPRLILRAAALGVRNSGLRTRI